MPVLTIVAGPNGSGKSTLVRSIEFEGRENFLNPDDIAAQLSPSHPQKAAFAAGRQVLERTQANLQAGISFAVETTLSSKQPLDTIRKAKDCGFYVNVVYVALNEPEKNILRVSERVALGGHDVPDEDVRRRYGRSLANAAEALRLAHEAVVYDNSGLRHEKVLEVRDGVVTWRAAKMPEWASQVHKELTGI